VSIKSTLIVSFFFFVAFQYYCFTPETVFDYVMMISLYYATDFIHKIIMLSINPPAAE